MKIPENMTVLKLRSLELDTWTRQNKGEYLDCIEGCLTDSFLIACRRGYAVAAETYVNEWSSTHTIYFQPFPALDVLEMWDRMTEDDAQSA